MAGVTDLKKHDFKKGNTIINEKICSRMKIPKENRYDLLKRNYY
jgi:hypothetical protein